MQSTQKPSGKNKKNKKKTSPFQEYPVTQNNPKQNIASKSNSGKEKVIKSPCKICAKDHMTYKCVFMNAQIFLLKRTLGGPQWSQTTLSLLSSNNILFQNHYNPRKGATMVHILLPLMKDHQLFTPLKWLIFKHKPKIKELKSPMLRTLHRVQIHHHLKIFRSKGLSQIL